MTLTGEEVVGLALHLHVGAGHPLRVVAVLLDRRLQPDVAVTRVPRRPLVGATE